MPLKSAEQWGTVRFHLFKHVNTKMNKVTDSRPETNVLSVPRRNEYKNFILV